MSSCYVLLHHRQSPLLARKSCERAAGVGRRLQSRGSEVERSVAELDGKQVDFGGINADKIVIEPRSVCFVRD